jgi:hypothetical protein
MAFNETVARSFLEDVIKKLKASAKKYDDNAYQVADIPKEVNEELVDIVGWPLLEVLRIQEIMEGKLATLESIYWDNFMKRQTDEFLHGLHQKILEELKKRGQAEFKITY